MGARGRKPQIKKILNISASNLNKVSTLVPKRKVNLERAIRLGEEIPGAFFYGVPSGQVKVMSLEMLSNEKLIMKTSFENGLLNYLSVGDQVCLDGVLLQIKEPTAHLIGKGSPKFSHLDTDRASGNRINLGSVSTFFKIFLDHK